MINKKEFIDMINFIKSQREKEENFVKALEGLSESTYCDCYLYDEYEDKLVKLLEIDLKDDNHEISYFLYDLDCLNTGVDGTVAWPKEENGTILYDSIETLYDYLVGDKQYD